MWGSIVLDVKKVVFLWRLFYGECCVVYVFFGIGWWVVIILLIMSISSVFIMVVVYFIIGVCGSLNIYVMLFGLVSVGLVISMLLVI